MHLFILKNTHMKATFSITLILYKIICTKPVLHRKNDSYGILLTILFSNDIL